MQMAKPISMAAPQIIIVRQFFDDLANTNISKAGCRWLSKTNWKELGTFSLSSIKII